MDLPETSALTPAQQRAAIMHASGMSMAAIARKLQVNTRTIYNWYEKAEFRKFVDALRAAVLDRAFSLIVQTTIKAASVLDKLLDSDDETIRLKAATTVNGTAIKMRECLEFDRRFKAIEEHGIASTPDETSDDNDDLYADLLPLIKDDDDKFVIDRALRADGMNGNGHRPRRNGIPPS